MLFEREFEYKYYKNLYLNKKLSTFLKNVNLSMEAL